MILETSINLDDQLADHLCIPESAIVLHHHQFGEHLIGKDHEPVRVILNYVLDYIDKEGRAPTAEMIEYDCSVHGDEPKCDIEWLITQFNDRYRRNQLKKTIADAAQTALNDPTATLHTLDREITQIKRETSSRAYEMSVKDFGTAIESYKNRVKTGAFKGVTFGFDEMDDLLGGLRKHGLYFLAARMKVGKSFLLLKSAVENTFSDDPVRSLFATLEMTAEEMFDRFMCMAAGVPYGMFMKGQLQKEHYTMLREAREVLEELPEGAKPIFYHPPRWQNMRTVSSLRQKARSEDAGIMYLDQLSFVEPSRQMSADMRRFEMTQISEDLKEASHDFPIYCAVQLNREAANIKEMSDVSKLADSDYMARVADMVLGLFQSKEMRQNNIMEIGVLAARNFETANWNLQFNIGRESDIKMIGRVEDA